MLLFFEAFWEWRKLGIDPEPEVLTYLSEQNYDEFLATEAELAIRDEIDKALKGDLKPVKLIAKPVTTSSESTPTPIGKLSQVQVVDEVGDPKTGGLVLQVGEPGTKHADEALLYIETDEEGQAFCKNKCVPLSYIRPIESVGLEADAHVAKLSTDAKDDAYKQGFDRTWPSWVCVWRASQLSEEAEQLNSNRRGCQH